MRLSLPNAGPSRLSIAVAALLSLLISSTIFADDSQDPFASVASILLRRCVECHHSNNASGSLKLDSHQGLLAGGDSGPAIVPHDPQSSVLLERIDAAEMPPPEKGHPRPLKKDEREALASWITAGAPWPENRILDPFETTTDVRGGRDWWAFQPLRQAPSPQAPRLSASRSPIDAFVDQRLHELSLVPAEEADPNELIRRATFDITGLPPDDERLATFLADRRPDAYEREIDRLLASPRFGERWARQWLDVVRYADTSGYERDQEKPYAWQYRDWVIDAFNTDLPFDRFVLEQLAGDEVADANRSTVIATGMLRLGTWNDEPNDPHEYQYERLEDLVNVTFSAFSALTVKCARCHDHKFDPISQIDYHQVASAFWAGYVQPGPTEWLGGPPADVLGYPDVLGWTDRGPQAPELHLLASGDPNRPQQVIPFGQLSLLPDLSGIAPEPQPEARTTGRRLALARWLIDPANPLTYRVAANRIWQGYFGAGLVRSSDNFGYTGDLPSHPELLDWLAASIGRSTDSDRDQTDGRLKRLHRKLLVSSTYRRSSDHPSPQFAESRDASARTLWRHQRRRLDAEGLRDALLAASGELDLRMQGPGFTPTLAAEALEGLSRKSAAWSASPPAEQRRRSVYMHTSRSLVDPLLTTFDFVDTTMVCSRRETSTVAPQALALLNDPFMHQRVEQLVDDLLQSTPNAEDSFNQHLDACLDQLWQRTLHRLPHETERAAARDHLQRRLAAFQRAELDLEAAAQPADPLETRERDWPADTTAVYLADEGVETDERGRVLRWRDVSGNERHAVMDDPQHQPSVSGQGPPRVVFDGQRRFLRVQGPLLTDDSCTIFAVVTDDAQDGLREIVSNWNGGVGNAGSSLFLGLTGNGTVRWTDDYAGAGNWQDRTQPAILSAVNGDAGASVWLGLDPIGDRSNRLAPRRLDTPWVIGTQGNIDGEYWYGSISALVVVNRALDASERELVIRQLAQRFDIAFPTPPRRSPAQRAWESLALVLLNTNEFLHVD